LEGGRECRSTGEKGNTYWVLVRKPEGKNLLQNVPYKDSL